MYMYIYKYIYIYIQRERERERERETYPNSLEPNCQQPRITEVEDELAQVKRGHDIQVVQRAKEMTEKQYDNVIT